jgi:hypothetical protein
MRPLAASIAVLLYLLQIHPACADCTEINSQASVWRAAFILAKEDYKRETAAILGKPFSEETIAIGIASSTKMKIAMDGLIEILDRSMAEGCFGGDAAVWRDVIEELKSESSAIAKTIQTYLDMQEKHLKSGTARD